MNLAPGFFLGPSQNQNFLILHKKGREEIERKDPRGREPTFSGEARSSLGVCERSRPPLASAPGSLRRE